jgi:hypothetical protein
MVHTQKMISGTNLSLIRRIKLGLIGFGSLNWMEGTIPIAFLVALALSDL